MSVSSIVSKYVHGGLEAITGNHYAGNRHNMTFEEEAALLAPFRERARNGQIVSVAEMAAAYQAQVGHAVGENQIYAVLRRHGWRKVMPRSRHPKKASEEAIEASKKLTIE